jgi:hypothetical protein
MFPVDPEDSETPLVKPEGGRIMEIGGEGGFGEGGGGGEAARGGGEGNRCPCTPISPRSRKVHQNLAIVYAAWSDKLPTVHRHISQPSYQSTIMLAGVINIEQSTVISEPLPP